MPIYPLWTGLILGPPALFNETSASTNECAENWMRIVKRNVLEDVTKLRPGEFIRKNVEESAEE